MKEELMLMVDETLHLYALRLWWRKHPILFPVLVTGMGLGLVYLGTGILVLFLNMYSA